MTKSVSRNADNDKIRSLNVAWPLGIISQGKADLLNTKIQTLVEVHERITAPELLPQFFARDELAGMANQQLEKLRRLGLQVD